MAVKVLSERQDYYNIHKTRNSENTDNFEYNCGGYALNTFAWYEPCDIDAIEDDIAYYIQEGLSKEEIYNIILSHFTDIILSEFQNIRLITDSSEIKSDERLIYFRYFYNTVSDFDDNWEDNTYYSYIRSDFHFRFFENGHWYEKCGSQPICTCDGEDIDGPVWACGVNIYDSPIVKFALKI